jgi:Flp pilus assembly protein TadD
VGRSRVIAGHGDYVAAAEPLRPAFRTNRPDIRAMDQLASLFADAGDLPRLRAIVSQLNEVAPQSEAAGYYSASLEFMAGRPDGAIRLAEQLHPRTGRGLNLLGAAYAAAGRHDDARRAFTDSVRANPRDPTSYINRGDLEMDAGHPRAALGYFAEALILEPSSTQARDGLARARAAAGLRATSPR